MATLPLWKALRKFIRAGWRKALGMESYIRFRRVSRSIATACSVTATYTGICASLSCATVSLWFGFRPLAVALSILPLFFGGLVFLAMVCVIPGLQTSKRSRNDAWVFPTLYLACVVGVKIFDERTLAPLVVIGDSPRTDFVWLEPWLVGTAWVLLVVRALAFGGR